MLIINICVAGRYFKLPFFNKHALFMCTIFKGWELLEEIDTLQIIQLVVKSLKGGQSKQKRNGLPAVASIIMMAS